MSLSLRGTNVIFTTGRFMLSHALLFVLVFHNSYLALWSPRLEKRELVSLLLVHLFINFARVNFCPFSFHLRVRDCLQLVVVTRPGLFY